MKLLQLLQLISATTVSLILVLCQSCITQEKCNERYPPKVEKTDSTHIDHFRTVTTNTVYGPTRYVVIHDTIIDCPELNYSNIKTDNGVTATLIIKKGKIYNKCEADSLREIIKTIRDSVNTARLIETKTTPKCPPCPTYSHSATKWDIFCYGVTFAILGALIVLLLKKIAIPKL